MKTSIVLALRYLVFSSLVMIVVMDIIQLSWRILPSTIDPVISPSHSSRCTQLWQDKLARRDRRLREREAFITRWQKVEKSAYDPFEPDWDCEVSDRVGTPPMGDGGKYVCGPELFNKSSCLLYGVGGGDFLFEKAIKDVGSNCEVHGFDPTFNPEGIPIIKDLPVSFHSVGIGSGEMKNYKGELTKLKTLPEIMQELGHVGRRIDLLKIDCEGCEFYVLPPIFEMVGRGELDIGQILVEMHGTQHESVEKFFQTVANSNLFTFHKERNHDGCDGYRCVEYGFITPKTALDNFNRYTGCSLSSPSISKPSQIFPLVV